MATLLGLDFGLKHIGVAVGQTITRSATPMTTVGAADGRPDWTALDALIREWQPERLIIGLPLNMEGKVSDMAKRAQRFANRLNARRGRSNRGGRLRRRRWSSAWPNG